MNTYKVMLTRSYLVTIQANNESEAKSFAEFFIGNCKDESTLRDREKWNFAIDEIEMTHNEALDVDEEQLKFL